MASFMDLPPELRRKCFVELSLLTRLDHNLVSIHALPYIHFEYPLPISMLLLNRRTSAEALDLVFTSLCTLNLGMPIQQDCQVHERTLKSVTAHPYLPLIQNVRINVIVHVTHAGHLRRKDFMPDRLEWALIPKLVDCSAFNKVQIVACGGHYMRFNRGGPGMGLNSWDVLEEVLHQLSGLQGKFDFAYAAALHGFAFEPLSERGDELVKAVMRRVDYARMKTVTPMDVALG